MTGITGARTDAKQNRERVLAAARMMLAERGLHAEMKEIAERAGVGVGTLYRNFATKEELVDAIVREMLADFDAALEVAEGIADPRDALLYLLRMAWDTVEDNGEIIEALVRGGYEKHAPDDRTTMRLIAIFQRGVEMGRFREDVPPAFLRDFLEISIPLVYWQLRQRWSREDAMRYCEAMFLSAVTGDGGGEGTGG